MSALHDALSQDEYCPARLRHAVIRAGADASPVCHVRRTSGLVPDHDATGAPVGHDATRRAAGDVGPSPLDGETVCRVVERVRSLHRGAAAPTLAGPKTPATTAYLHGRGDWSIDGRGGATAIPHGLARSHLHDAHRPAGGHRPAPWRGVELDRSDVDFDDGILSIRESKFGKSRLVPIAPSTRDALQRYSDRRDAVCGRPSSRGVSPLRPWPARRRVGRSGHVRQADV